MLHQIEKQIMSLAQKRYNLFSRVLAIVIEIILKKTVRLYNRAKK